MLDDRHRLTGEDGLIDPERGGVDLDETNVGGDLVADGDLDNVAGDNLVGLDLLDAVLVGADDLAHLRLVLLQGFNGGLGIPLL